MKYSVATLAAILGAAQAVDVQVVSVGRNPVNNATGLKFWPDNIKAEPGTMVQFQFLVGNHTVTQSNFDNPCVKLQSDNGTVVDSSFMPAAASADKGEIPTFTVMVNDKKPMWLYCAQGPHCEKGMAMVINENTAANSTRSLDNYKSMAAGATPGGETGGNTGGSTGGETGGNTGGSTGGNGESGSTPTGGSESPTGSESGAPSSSTSQPATAGASVATVSSSLLLGISAVFMML